MRRKEDGDQAGTQEPGDRSFWTIDEALGEVELKERPDSPERYTVRLKAHTAVGPYHGNRELYPLEHDGAEHEVAGKAYILVPDITLTVGLFPAPQPSGPIGTVTGSEWQGMRHHEIASVRGLYYDQDRALGIWEVDTYGRLDAFTHGRLWQLFETFLVARFPTATRVYTDDSEPGEDIERNREFLQALGYIPVAGSRRILSKEVAR